MNKECERRLRIMGTSSVVGGDIRAALAEVDRLRAERDRRNKVDPITRLHNLCDGLADQRGGSPYSAEAWAAQDEAYSAKCVENEELRTECNALRAAAQAFLAKHDALEPAIANAFMLAQIHGCPYKGDNWSAELETLRSLAVEGERG